jgi:hypothetical protein
MVHFVGINGLDGGLRIPGDLSLLRSEMHRTGALLLVLDPLGAHLSGALDTHRDASVRQALAPLAAHMEGLGAAAIGVMHWNKAPTNVALDRVNGSRAFTAAARSVLAVGEDPEDVDTHVLVVAESNLGRLDVPALRYRIDGRTVRDLNGKTIDTSGVLWLGEAPHITARDLFAVPFDGGERSDRDAMAEIVREVLADGMRPRDEVRKAIRDAGLPTSEKTLQRVCRTLGVEHRRVGFGPGATFLLELPQRPMPDKVDRDPVAHTPVHYVQNGADQQYPEDTEPIVDSMDSPSGPISNPHCCYSCGAPVTPAPKSLENGWVTACTACASEGR